jgi:hypothetical protein
VTPSSERPRRALLLVGVALLGGCTLERVEEHEIAEWQVAATPLVAIGDTEDRDTVVFGGVSDARLHRSGALVVADNGNFGVRVYDAKGVLRVSAGRRGRGPNEFNGAMSFADAPGDSVAVWDSGQTRWTMFNVVDGGMRTSREIRLYPAWMHAGVMVHSARSVPPAWVLPLLTRLSRASADTRAAYIDPDGLLFVSRDVERTSWHVYRDSVAPIASITLPAEFAVTHFATNAVVGLVSDSVGLQRVVSHALLRAPFEAPDTAPAAPLAADPERRGALKASLRNAVTAQEMHWVKGQAYTAARDSLEVAMPEGAEFKVLEATPRGWRGVAWFPATGLTCGMIVGLTVPPGWSEGEVNCGWSDPST